MTLTPAIATLAPPVRVPYVDLPAHVRPLRQQLLDAVAAVLDSGQFILGPQVEQFELRFAALTGSKFAVALNSGTDALILALRALNIGPGDQVITAPNSFVATTSAIRLVGATPVFVDADDSFNLDPRKLLDAVTPWTKAILPVHLTGRPADMDAINAVARPRSIPVIEDAAQAVGARYRGRHVGSLGTLGAFSLHPLKTLSACGDAGVLTTDDKPLADKLRLLRNLGLRSREQCETWSGNSRLDTLQAAILLVKLDHLDAWVDKRRAIAAHYRRQLAGIPHLLLPAEHEHERPAYHTFIIQSPRRDQLKNFLAAQGIQTAIHYPIPIHLQDAARPLGLPPGSFPVAERQATQILSLPVYPELTDDQLDHVVSSIRAFHQA